MRIINQKGETISVADEGSGTLKLAGTDETSSTPNKLILTGLKPTKK